MQNVIISRAYARWTPEERQQMEKLAQLNQNGGRIDWKAVSQALGTKSPRQCYDQYSMAERRLSEHNGKHLWTKAEEERLIGAFQRNKYEWDYIQEHYFPQLSITQLKNKVNSLRHRGEMVSDGDLKIAGHQRHKSQSESTPTYETQSEGNLIQLLQTLLGQIQE